VLYVTQCIITRPAGTRVREIINHYHDIAANLDVVMYVYVVDAGGSLQGDVDLRDLDTLHDAVEFFARYSFRGIPVTDEKEERPG